MSVLVFVCSQFLSGNYKSFKVISASMEPTLGVGDCVIVEQAGQGDLRGKVVAFHSPQDPEEILTKRVIAASRDLVSVRDGQMYVNNELAPGEKVQHVRNRSWVVGRDRLFVEGDNRNNSFDSIDYGPVPRENLVGVVAYRYWPPGRLGTLN